MFIASTYPHGPHPEAENVTADQVKLFPYDKTSQRYIKGSKKYIKAKAGYYKHIENDNAQLEKVVALVDKYAKNNTMFIYSADHGHVGKYSVYDSGLNVPFVVRWPGVIEAGTVSDKLIHYTDVVPTYINLAGGKEITDIDGKSFLSILKGGEQDIHEYVYGVVTNQNIWQCKVFPIRMVRSKKYKYIRNFNSVEVLEKNLGEDENVNIFIKRGAEMFKDKPFEELYDIENDPFEQNNLANDQSFSSIKEQLANELLSWMQKQNDVLLEYGPMPILYAPSHPLDQYSRFNKIPKEIQNILNPDDAVHLHY